MKKTSLSLLIIFFICTTTLKPKNNIGFLPPGVGTVKPSKRLGDSVVTLCKLIYLSKKYNLEPWYTPLYGLNQFSISALQQVWNPVASGTHGYWDKVIHILHENTLIEHSPLDLDNNFYVVHAGTRLNTGYEFWNDGSRFWQDGKQYHYATLFEYTIENPKYHEKIKQLLTPLTKIKKIALPSNKISIAVHVRKGSGGDPPLYSTQIYKIPWADRRWPQKFPPDQYYLDQIKKLSNLLENPPLYIHLFTDHKNPAAIVQKYKSYLNMENIEFSYQKNSNVLGDIFNMTRFDCFISSLSNFSFIPQILGNNKVIINPSHFKWEGKKLIVDKVKISIPDRINHIAKQYRFDGGVLHLRDEVLAALKK